MTLLEQYSQEVISTVILTVVYFLTRFLVSTLVLKYARLSELIDHRANLIIKYIHILINILALISLSFIWGVQTKDLFLALSSAFTIIGVAMFAQWSILSNVTSGVILFFSNPFKIGDVVKIHDKEFPFEAEVIDIQSFHTFMKTEEGEIISFPNNLLLQKGISIVNKKFEHKEFTD